jgi:alcohol dehydrogenase
METFNFSVPQDITVGKGSLSKLPEIAKKLGGKHALIISGPHLEKMGLVKKAADYLASVDIKADTFTDIEANPSVTTVEKATALYRGIRRRLTDGCGKSSGRGCQIWRKRHRL